MPQAHGHAPPGHAAGGIGLRNGLESFTRLLVPERVEHGNSFLSDSASGAPGQSGCHRLIATPPQAIQEAASLSAMDLKPFPASSYQTEEAGKAFQSIAETDPT